MTIMTIDEITSGEAGNGVGTYADAVIRFLETAAIYSPPEIGLETAIEEYAAIEADVKAHAALLDRICQAAKALIPRTPTIKVWQGRWFIEALSAADGFYVQAYPPDGRDPIRSREYRTPAAAIESIKAKIEETESGLLRTPVTIAHLRTLKRLVSRFKDEPTTDWEINTYLNSGDLGKCLALCRVGLLKRDIRDRHNIEYSWSPEWAQTYALPELYERAMQSLLQV